MRKIEKSIVLKTNQILMVPFCITQCILGILTLSQISMIDRIKLAAISQMCNHVYDTCIQNAFISTPMGVDYSVIGFDMEVQPQCSLTFMLFSRIWHELFSYRCRLQS